MLRRESRDRRFKNFPKAWKLWKKDPKVAFNVTCYKSDTPLSQDGFIQFRMLIFYPKIDECSANHLAEGCSALHNPSEVERKNTFLCSLGSPLTV